MPTISFSCSIERQWASEWAKENGNQYEIWNSELFYALWEKKMYIKKRNDEKSTTYDNEINQREKCDNKIHGLRFSWNKTSGFDRFFIPIQICMRFFFLSTFVSKSVRCKFIQNILSRGQFNFKYYHLNNKSVDWLDGQIKGFFVNVLFTKRKKKKCEWKSRHNFSFKHLHPRNVVNSSTDILIKFRFLFLLK